MANKRMFSLSVVDTDRFLEMPISSRLLYYELGMRADDDGFVDNWKKILMFTGLKEDDMRVLASKQFIIPFESGVIVIRHWRMNNYLQNDRTKPTIYQEELSQLSYDKSSGVYSLDTTCIHSIDKNSIDKNIYILEKNNFEEEFEELWKVYPNKQGKKNALTKYIKVRKSGISFEEILEGLKRYLLYCHQNRDWYKPKNGETWFSKQSWNDELKLDLNKTQNLVDFNILDFSKFEEKKEVKL